MATRPFFSIITINFNHYDGLHRTAQSLYQQQCHYYEWIVIDGGSTDGSVAFLQKQEDTCHWISEPDRGIYDAMNKGIDRAQGQYLWFMNAGDIFYDNHTLSMVHEKIRGHDFIYGDAIEGDHMKKARHHKNTLYKNALWGMITHHQSMIYCRNTIGTSRYSTSFDIAADYDFTIRFLSKSKSVCYLETPLCIFEEGGISQQKTLKARHEQFIIRQQLGITVWKNVMIFLIQTGAMWLRKICPAAYWFFKK